MMVHACIQITLKRSFRVVFVIMLILLLALTIFRAKASDFSNLESKLLGPEWQDVISQGGMHIGSGRVKRFVEISMDQPNIAYRACSLPNGKSGQCRHMRFCIQEEFGRDFTKFIDYLCVINHSFIGACCPAEVIYGSSSLAGNLPATAPREEQNEAILKITRAENRGCGLSTRPHGRVMGSRPANPREWPWMASITPEGHDQYCGGALITDRHVLTAAHCTEGWTADKLYVRLGEYDFKRTDDSRSYNFRVVEKRQHLDFDHTNYKNDISILKLHRPAVFNTYVWPICLPPLDLQLINQSAIIIGWGTQWYGGPHSDILMEVAVPIWDQQTCINSFTDSVFDENICAGGYQGGKDSCQYDSGGPLMYQMSSTRWVVIGVVSWGLRCGEPNHPGIYTRVDKYLEWIVENAQF